MAVAVAVGLLLTQWLVLAAELTVAVAVTVAVELIVSDRVKCLRQG